MPKPNSHSSGAVRRGIGRREILAAGLATAVAPAWIPGAARAQQFPSKTIRIIVPTPPGGSIDPAARGIADKMGEALGASVIIVNMPGASGSLAVQHVIGSEPDGHTLIVGTASPIVVAPQAMKSVKFDPLTDLTAVNMLSFTSIAIGVHPRSKPGRSGS